MLSEIQLEKINEPLLSWFETHKRVLPWRENPTPYRVWVSEIMLQQTRVEAVKPYFERFTKELPDLRHLAECDEERLLKLWEGLGYYNRVRNMQIAAKTVTRKGWTTRSDWNRSLYGRCNCFDRLWDTGSGGGWQCTAGHHEDHSR